MRILVATDQWFPDLKGGVARVATESSRRLAERGHDVVVLAPRVDGLPAVERAGRLELRRVLARTPLPVTFTDVEEVRRRAARLAGPFDLVLAHACTGALGLSAAGLGAPLVFVYHSPTAQELRALRRRMPRRRDRAASYGLAPALALIERLAVDRSFRVLLLSEFSHALFLGDHPQHGARVRRVPGAVDVDWFEPDGGPAAARRRLGIDGTAPLLMTARRLEPRMGLEELLEAAGLLNEDGAVDLAIVGAGSLEPRLRQLRSRLGLERRVRLLGALDDRGLRDWYRAADLFVLPTVAYEGFGLVTAEALACGAPVVGTPVGATPELLSGLDPALLADGARPEALAAAIRRSLAAAGPGLRRRCREHAVARFSWDGAIGDWEAALLEAAGSGRRAPAARPGRAGVRAAAKETAGAVVRRGGVGWLLRRAYSHARVGILVYHDPEPELLERHLRYLAPRYRFVTLDALVDAIRRRDWSSIPPDSLVLTFDDGHSGNRRLVDVLRGFGVVPTIFLCSQLAGTRRRFWWTTPGVDVGVLKRLPEPDRLGALQRAGWSPTREYDGPPQALSAAQIAGMNGSVDFEAHSRFHPLLPRLADAECRDEIALCRREVEELSGRACRHFAFPNGDFGQRERELVEGAGYLSARTTRTGWNGPGADPYALRAIGVADGASVDVLALQLTGIRAAWEAAGRFGARLRAAAPAPTRRSRSCTPSGARPATGPRT